MGSSGGDPHRVLGVPRDASAAEIRRAYRALAKRHHPDGGQGSVARFLAIQAAYEALAGGGQGIGPGGRPAAPGGTAPGASPRTGSDWAGRPRPWSSSSTRRDQGPPATGGSKAGERARPESTRGRRPGARRRATLGSTSYDEAEEAFEPGWGGASWYGPSSGTYWTLNPREYADPRKHGPEYQARARRPAPPDGPAASGPSAPGEPTPGPAVPPEPTPAPGARPGAVARILARWRRGTIRP